MDLCFSVTNQVLKRTDSEKVVNKSNKYLTLNFSFSKDWEDLSTFLLLRNNGPNITRYSITEGKVTLGGSVLNGDSILITVYGVDTDDNTRITTNQAKVVLRDSGYVACTPEEEEAVDIITEMYEAIMSLETVDLDVTYLDGSTGSWKVLVK